MTERAILVRDVSKCYHIFENQRARLRHAFWPSRNEGMSEVWALRGINFEVKRGDSVAIIGRNGSGKSTLLEIITQTLTPTMGHVQIKGRIAALLELGSGFKPDYSGRENVFLNGLLLGLSRAEVERRYDEIVSFADIGPVLERPVKTYSSGMLVRLAFAVQVALEPEILIVDEALSVGDYFFQQKCFGRLRQMRENGLTLLFVSHDMGTVRDLCNQAVYLRQGHMEFTGDTTVAVRRYLAERPQTNGLEPHKEHPGVTLETSPTEGDDVSLGNGGGAFEHAIWRRYQGEDGGTSRRLLAVAVFGSDGKPTLQAKIADTIRVLIHYVVPPEESGHIALVLKNKFDQVVTVIGSLHLGLTLSRGKPGVLEFQVQLMLEAGLYSFQVAYSISNGANTAVRLDETSWLGPLQTLWDYESERAPFLGMVGLPVKGRVEVNDTGARNRLPV